MISHGLVQRQRLVSPHECPVEFSSTVHHIYISLSLLCFLKVMSLLLNMCLWMIIHFHHPYVTLKLKHLVCKKLFSLRVYMLKMGKGIGLPIHNPQDGKSTEGIHTDRLTRPADHVKLRHLATIFPIRSVPQYTILLMNRCKKNWMDKVFGNSCNQF